MRVLLAISLLALAGVLWASLAAAQHIRRARRRNRRAAIGTNTDQAVNRSEEFDRPPGNDSVRRDPLGTEPASTEHATQMRFEKAAPQPAPSFASADKANRSSDSDLASRLRSLQASPTDAKFRTASR